MSKVKCIPFGKYSLISSALLVDWSTLNLLAHTDRIMYCGNLLANNTSDVYSVVYCVKSCYYCIKIH